MEIIIIKENKKIIFDGYAYTVHHNLNLINLETVEKAKVEMLKRVSTLSTSTPSQIFRQEVC